ncbi:hypothetical protein EUX98_g9248 [Antrodiella citrinella]|uniref:Uncharacterized protein n=1 Tax=Antrodiella citrinella TaxID=2447956 RepID=A0A4S4LXZ3_9APHY|nr:hypothetical protein EUX98_g9248 [Antrodiella citrinella]
MAEIPYDLLGLIFGILGIVGLIPLLWAAVRYQLPHHKLRQLDATLEETNSLLESAIRDGLVPSVEFVLEMRHLLRLCVKPTTSPDHMLT